MPVTIHSFGEEVLPHYKKARLCGSVIDSEGYILIQRNIEAIRYLTATSTDARLYQFLHFCRRINTSFSNFNRAIEALNKFLKQANKQIEKRNNISSQHNSLEKVFRTIDTMWNLEVYKTLCGEHSNRLSLKISCNMCLHRWSRRALGSHRDAYTQEPDRELVEKAKNKPVALPGRNIFGAKWD